MSSILYSFTPKVYDLHTVDFFVLLGGGGALPYPSKGHIPDPLFSKRVNGF